MTVQLEQSPFLSLISDQRIRQSLRPTARSPDVPLTSDVARHICERTGSAAVLEGSIASLGNQYVLGLRAKSCRSGDILDEEQAQAPRKEDVLKALSHIATKLRTRLGESLATIQQHDTPLAEATAPSLEALEAYSEAWKVHFSSGASASLILFKRAVEIDPKFAMAHAALGRIYADLDESDLSAESTSRGWQLRSGTSDREKFFLTAAYETLVTGNEEEAQQTFEAWARTYPEGKPCHVRFCLATPTRPRVNMKRLPPKPARAIESYRDLSFGYYGLAVNQAFLGRLDEAENTLRRARCTRPRDRRVHHA